MEFATAISRNASNLLRVAAAAVALGIGPALADDDDAGFYLGLGTSAAFFDADYRKAVDNRAPANMTANAGRLLVANASADEATWDVAAFAGYRFGGAVYLDIEADFSIHRGTASGRLPGAGSSPGRNQLGEVWPEDWSLTRDRSHGFTLRLGTHVPSLGAGVYVIGGLRRVYATFRSSYTGCVLTVRCGPGQFIGGSTRRGEKYDGWTAGVGVEKPFGRFAVRSELRYADHGGSKRTEHLDELGLAIPVEVGASEVAIGIGLVWRP